jgi:hypothetical protein
MLESTADASMGDEATHADRQFGVQGPATAIRCPGPGDGEVW